MTQTMSPQCTYRRTNGGTWAVMGPVDVIKAGAVVTVAKRSGETKTETIVSTGKVFVRDGVRMRYGYPDRTDTTPTYVRTDDGRITNARIPAPRRSGRPMCLACGERRAVTTAVDLSGIGGDVCGICARDGAISFA